MTAPVTSPSGSVRPETLAMVEALRRDQAQAARWWKAEEAVVRECADADRRIARAAPYLDAPPRPPGKIRPSQILALRYYMLHSFGHHREARKFLADTLAEARRRYRDGNYATPFGEPVRRPLAERAA